MPTENYGLPTISGEMTADVVRDVNALAEATDDVLKDIDDSKANSTDLIDLENVVNTHLEQIKVEAEANTVAKRDANGSIKSKSTSDKDYVLSFVDRVVSEHETGQTISITNVISGSRTTNLLVISCATNNVISYDALYLLKVTDTTNYTLTPILPVASDLSIIVVGKTVNVSNISGTNRTLSISLVRLV